MPILPVHRHTLPAGECSRRVPGKTYPLPRVAEWRERRLLSQQELADAVKMARSTIARLEVGEPARPSTVRKLAAALSVEPAALMRPAA